MKKPYLCRNFFITDWRRMRRKNTIQISSIYWNVLLWIFYVILWMTIREVNFTNFQYTNTLMGSRGRYSGYEYVLVIMIQSFLLISFLPQLIDENEICPDILKTNCDPKNRNNGQFAVTFSMEL